MNTGGEEGEGQSKQHSLLLIILHCVKCSGTASMRQDNEDSLSTLLVTGEIKVEVASY